DVQCLEHHTPSTATWLGRHWLGRGHDRNLQGPSHGRRVGAGVDDGQRRVDVLRSVGLSWREALLAALARDLRPEDVAERAGGRNQPVVARVVHDGAGIAAGEPRERDLDPSLEAVVVVFDQLDGAVAEPIALRVLARLAVVPTADDRLVVVTRPGRC